MLNEQDIQSEIDKLQPKIDEAKLAASVKRDFAEFLNGDITDPAQMRVALKRSGLYLKTHPDRGGSTEIFQAVSALKDAKNSAEVQKALNNLKTLLNEKASGLSGLQNRMNKLNNDLAAMRTKNANVETETQAPKEQPVAEAKPEGAKSKSMPAERRTPLNNEQFAQIKKLDAGIAQCRTQSDLAAIEAQLKDMPDCATVRNLKNKIEAHKRYLPETLHQQNVDVEVVAAEPVNHGIVNDDIEILDIEGTKVKINGDDVEIVASEPVNHDTVNPDIEIINGEDFDFVIVDGDIEVIDHTPPSLSGKALNLSNQIDAANTLGELNQLQKSVELMPASSEKDALMQKIKDKKQELKNPQVYVLEEDNELEAFRRRENEIIDQNNDLSAQQAVVESLDDANYHVDEDASFNNEPDYGSSYDVE